MTGMVYVCPLDPEHHIEPLEPADPAQAMLNLEVTPRPGEDPLHALTRAAVEARVADDEAMLLMHLETHHTMQDFALALGTARNALMDVQRYLTDSTVWPSHQKDIRKIVDRGLGRQ